MSLFCRDCEEHTKTKLGIWMILGVVFGLGLLALFFPKKHDSLLAKIKSKLKK